jgi:hypothetical protein
MEKPCIKIPIQTQTLRYKTAFFGVYGQPSTILRKTEKFHGYDAQKTNTCRFNETMSLSPAEICCIDRDLILQVQSLIFLDLPSKRATCLNSPPGLQRA